MLKILFFAQTRELVGYENLTLPAKFENVDALRTTLAEKGEKWALALQKGKLLVAVNQKLCALDTPLYSGDEVAFFPPVTGG